MTAYEALKLVVISYVTIQFWMLIALMTEEISMRNDLHFGAKESYIMGPLGLVVCIMLYVEKQYKKWKMEQNKKWDR